MDDVLRSTYQSVKDGTSKPQMFIQLAEEIDWTTRTPDELASTIEMALHLEMIIFARRLLAIAAEHGITNEKIEKLRRVLIPSGPITKGPANPKINDTMMWLRENGRNYWGLWVALDGGILLGTAETRKQLVEKVGERPDILITRIV
jgi:hypothetical protein